MWNVWFGFESDFARLPEVWNSKFPLCSTFWESFRKICSSSFNSKKDKRLSRDKVTLDHEDEVQTWWEWEALCILCFPPQGEGQGSPQFHRIHRIPGLAGWEYSQWVSVPFKMEEFFEKQTMKIQSELCASIIGLIHQELTSVKQEISQLQGVYHYRDIPFRLTLVPSTWDRDVYCSSRFRLTMLLMRWMNPQILQSQHVPSGNYSWDSNIPKMYHVDNLWFC